MKKQFNRMKQLANQTVGRAEKTEVFSEDLLQIERRMEVVRLVSHNTHKKLVTCLQGHIGTEVDKRHKKLPLMGLSQAMLDGSGQLEDLMIGKMMEVCGDAENKLAYEQSQLEVHLERDVLDPLNQLAEVDIPNIVKQRKQLAKLVLDYDSARARHFQASKAIMSATNNQAMAAKADSAKEEMDEAHNKVEICKDQLAADMYNFSSKEGDYAQYYVILLEAQAEYHRRSLAYIEKVLPTIRLQQETWMEKPAFGTALEEHLKRSNREIALPMEACVMMLLETGMKEEGLFRIAAGASKLKKLKAALDCSTSQLEEFYSDPHAVAGALKSYLRDLPEPLMTFQLYDEWIQASNVSDPDKKLQALWVTCDRLPKANKANMRYLVKFLAKLAQESEVNKMTSTNISIVLGPNLLWAKAEGSLAEMAAATSVHVVAIIELIILHADWFFPDDVDFNVSGMFAMPTGPTNQPGHFSTPEPEYSTISRTRPGSQGVPEAETSRKDSAVREPTATPPPLRNGPGGPGGTAGQLTVGTTTSSTKGPSPHIVRRGTKKPAPAPPKVAPSPSSPAAAPQKTTLAFPAQVQIASVTPSQPATLPRRHTYNQAFIQVPSHPPPQPPQAGLDTEPSPPNSPTPPGTPPHDDNPNSASLTRPRPVPRPRPRPSVPPPPQPVNDGANGVCSSASKIITDVGVTLKAPARLLVPQIDVEQLEATPPDAENQLESTHL
ncbi:rho GTPase-activating protein 17b isoform X3 [Trichomycterus rosablanca]|uniref:rho GTPase-activating protein 17b isoform X3 n=1 Tax=Trichomycterus rosablanca TaxID=2290929 RepID=UPI002F358908